MTYAERYERPASDAPSRSYEPRSESHEPADGWTEMSEEEMAAAAAKFHSDKPVIGSMFGDADVDSDLEWIDIAADTIEEVGLTEAQAVTLRALVTRLQAALETFGPEDN